MFLVFARAYPSAAMPQRQIISQLETLIGDPEANVMGPATLWFGWPSAHFRDNGATTFSYLYTGRLTMVRWLALEACDFHCR